MGFLLFSGAQEPAALSATFRGGFSPFFSKDQDVGSPFLSKGWMNGAAELSNHKRLPEPGNPLLFNYDKINNILYIIDRQNKIIVFPIDSVFEIDLEDKEHSYSFKKIPWISDDFFLIDIISSSKGYSLYKRLFTKLIRANYSNEGYYSVGKKYDEYVDYFEYYLTYPNNTQFRKLYLKENAIRKALKDESVLLEEFFNLHDKEINEASLLGIIQYINEKKYPD